MVHSAFIVRVAGQPYWANDPELVDDRIHCRKLLHQFNTTLAYDDTEGRQALLNELLGSVGEGKPAAGTLA